TNNIDIITLNDASSVDQFEDHAAEHPRLHCIEIYKSIRFAARARAGCYLHTFTSMWEAARQKTLPGTEKLRELFTQAGGSAMALTQQLTHQRTRFHRVHRPIELRRQVRRMLAGNKNHLRAVAERQIGDIRCIDTLLPTGIVQRDSATLSHPDIGQVEMQVD